MKTALMITFLFFSQQYNIELAITPTEKATGLMYRKQWNDDTQGMLFINEKPQQVSFWMKNTYLEMGIMYLDKDFNILEIHHPKPLSTTSILSKTSNVKYILEINPDLEQNIIDNWKQFKKLLKEQLISKEDEIFKLF